MTGDRDEQTEGPATEPFPGPVVLCVLLWATPGLEHDLNDYEDSVLGLLPAHGGRVVLRLRSAEGDADGPCEVQVLEFGSDAHLAEFMEDPRRTGLADVRERVIARTDVFRMRPDEARQ